jgi:hypothetical protein
LLHVGGPAPTGEDSAPPNDALQKALVAKSCKMGRDGLQANFSWNDPGTPTAPVNARGMLYDRELEIAELRCGGITLNSDNIKSVDDWFGDEQIVALFDVGHQPNTRVPDEQVANFLHGHLRPNAELEQEALRAINEDIRPSPQHTAGWSVDGLDVPFVAVHWRHGDYVPYKLLLAAEKLAERVQKALDELGCTRKRPCPVFLMTNCQDTKALAMLKDDLPTLVRYVPSATRFEEEGPKLLVEQAIATHANSFVGSPRSAVSEYIETVRHSRSGAKTRTKDASMKNEL